MIVVVEGPDNSGKTTLGLRLAKDLGGVFIKTNVRPVTNTVMKKFHWRVREMEDEFNVVVLDRHHAISEPIYGDILRKGHKVDLLEASLLCREMHVIYCRRTLAQLSDFVDGIPQLQGVKENIAKIHAYYEHLLMEHRRLFKSLHIYDWADTPYPPLLQSLKEKL